MVTITDDLCNENARDLSIFSTDLKDSYMNEDFDTVNFGLYATMYLGRGSGKGVAEDRVIALYDLKNIIPADAVPIAAVWKLYRTANSCTVGPIYGWALARCTRPDWHEGYVSYLNYDLYTPWDAPGGDMGAPSLSRSPGFGTGWVSIEILDLVTDAHANRDGILNMIWRRTDNLADAGQVYFNTKQSETPPGSGETVNAPHVSITYTLEGETFRVFVH